MCVCVCAGAYACMCVCVRVHVYVCMCMYVHATSEFHYSCVAAYSLVIQDDKLSCYNINIAQGFVKTPWCDKIVSANHISTLILH